MGKADYNAGRHMMSGSVFYNRFTDPGWDGGGTLLTAQIGQLQTEKSFKYQDVMTLRPNLLNTFVGSMLVLQSYNTRTSPFYIKDFGDVKIATPDRANAELELSVTGSSGWGSVSNSPPGEWIRDTIEFSDTLSYTRGRHSLALAWSSPLHQVRLHHQLQPERKLRLLRTGYRSGDGRFPVGQGLHLQAERG
jgi:hypothetical protein